MEIIMSNPCLCGTSEMLPHPHLSKISNYLFLRFFDQYLTKTSLTFLQLFLSWNGRRCRRCGCYGELRSERWVQQHHASFDDAKAKLSGFSILSASRQCNFVHSLMIWFSIAVNLLSSSQSSSLIKTAHLRKPTCNYNVKVDYFFSQVFPFLIFLVLIQG